jgi:hypothetical protein
MSTTGDTLDLYIRHFSMSNERHAPCFYLIYILSECEPLPKPPATARPPFLPRRAPSIFFRPYHGDVCGGLPWRD